MFISVISVRRLLTCDNANPKSHSELLFIHSFIYLAKSFSSIVSSCVESQETRLRENDTSKRGFNQINKHLTEGDKANQSFKDFVEIVCDICWQKCLILRRKSWRDWKMPQTYFKQSPLGLAFLLW